MISADSHAPARLPFWASTVAAAALAAALVFAARTVPHTRPQPWSGYPTGETHACRTLLQLGKPAPALDHAQRAAALAPSSAPAQNDLGNALIANEKIDEARTCYENALRLDPEYVDAHYNLANILLHQQHVTEAQAHYETVIKLAPGHADAHYNLGFIHLSAGRIDEARTHYGEAARLRPDHAPSQNGLALTLLQSGHAKEAIAPLRAALKADPKLGSARNNLAWLLATAPDATLRDGREALKLATQASEESGGTDASALKNLAAAHAELGEFAEALKQARAAEELASRQNQTAVLYVIRECIRTIEQNRPVRDDRIR